MIIFSNAKLNIGLNIIKKRFDDYHDIQTIYIPISLYDIIEIIPSNKDEFIFYGESCNELNKSIEENTCYRALMIIKDKVKLPPIKVIIYKKIPMKSGLGGGSSNAVFFVKLLNEIFNLKFSIYEIFDIVKQIGLDCAFFVYNKPMYGKGKGDILKKINLNLKQYKCALIISNNINISTKFAYALVKPKKPSFNLFNITKINIEDWKNFVVNDFEIPMFKIYPELKCYKDYLYEQGALYAGMTGSGSTIFGIFKEKKNLVLNDCKVIWVDFI
mgnify:CR=1 FL=1